MGEDEGGLWCLGWLVSRGQTASVVEVGGESSLLGFCQGGVNNKFADFLKANTRHAASQPGLVLYLPTILPPYLVNWQIQAL
jgi:hypothetical protein